jgi:hypothetical protein
MTARLERVNPDLFDRLRSASPVQQRAAARAACRFALDYNELVGPIIDAGWEAIETAKYGDSRPREQLRAFINQLEAIQRRARDCVEEGQASRAQYIAAFRRARAANSIYYALSSDAFEAAVESAYEANAATADIQALVQIISSAMYISRS